MDKAHTHIKIEIKVKAIYAFLTAVGLAIIAGIDLYEKKMDFAVYAGFFSVVLILYSGYLMWLKSARPSAIPELLLVGLLLVFTLFFMESEADVAHWVYFVPIYIYFLISFRWANVLLAIYTVALVGLVLIDYPIDLRPQILFAYLACYLISFTFALINHQNNSRLSKIINTDPITQVYNHHQLKHDLHKEIVRADRQRSQLHMLLIELPNEWRDLKAEAYENKLSMLGEKLHEGLRHYDTCYRIENSFVVLLPQTDLDIAKKACESMISKLSSFKGLQVSVEEYKHEDDVESLLMRLTRGVHNEG